MKNQPVTNRQPLLLTNPVFISSLLLLMLNDFVFKPVYHNWLTGKLSDFSGLIVLALLLAYLFPKPKGKAALVSALVFTLWKLPLSTPLIHFCNILHLPVHRTIDYTDLIALIVLPFTDLYILQIIKKDEWNKLPCLEQEPVVIDRVAGLHGNRHVAQTTCGL